MTWTVLTSSLLPLLTKLSLHAPLRLASRLTDTSAARITSSSSRETRQPGCVSAASPRLKSLHKCDLYWHIYETACPLLSLCARSCACCRAGVSNTNLLLVAWQTEGSSGSGPARRQSFCPSIQLSPPHPRNASNNRYWRNGGYIFTSRSIKITLCQLPLTFFWTVCLCFLTQSGSKVVEMLHSDELVFYSGGVFKTLFQGTFGAGHCVSHLLLYFISLHYKWHITSSLSF